MKIDHPLRFHPLFRHYLWGGRRLASLLGKPLPARQPVAESWEIVDRGPDQSLVVAGPHRGLSLAELLSRDRPGILGAANLPGPFPLLLKFLDAHQNLSVQVHPDDQQAAQLTPSDRGKTEAWVIVHAEPHSHIYAGLRAGVDRDRLKQAIEQGEAETCLHRFAARAGECVFIPAGTVHALGAGLVVAEIQQSSDVTYRLFDWNRVTADGQARPLHVQAGLDVIDFRRGPVNPCPPSPTETVGVEQLVYCDQFVLLRRRFTKVQTLGGDDRFHLVAVLSGTLRLAGDPETEPLTAGRTALLPARAGAVAGIPQGPVELLDIYRPSLA